jgi:hypothetical protein
MTKVLVEYELTAPLTPGHLQRIADLHGWYGFYRVTVAGEGGQISVEYDASRLTPDQVLSGLHRAGLPVKRRD